jgi:iron complex transport system permease protein
MILLLALCLIFAILELITGSVSIDFQSILSILSKNESESAQSVIIWESRIPRLFTAFWAGAGLALSGWIMQTLFRNPLASPSILGITSGASLGVALLMMSGVLIGVPLQGSLGTFTTAGAAMLGAVLVLLLVIAIASRMRDQVSLLIVGIMLGHFTSAIVSVLQFKTNPEALRSYVLWGMGTFTDTNYLEILLMAAIVAIGAVVIFFKKKALNILMLGDEYAQSLGVSVKKMRVVMIIVSGTMAGVITAFCGPIAFIGLAVPHFTRILLKTTHHATLFLPMILMGAAVGMGCDLISKTAEIPLNAVTSAMGAPVVIFILVKNAKSKALI